MQGTYQKEAEQIDAELQEHINAYNAYSKRLMYHWQNQMILDVLPPTGKILEIGSGIGNFLVDAEKRYPALYASEVAFETLKYGRNLLQQPHYFHLAQAECIPFRSNSFDGIVARGIIHHLESPADGLHEMGRVLRPGGKLVIFEGDPRALYRILSLGLAEKMGKQHELTQFYHRSYSEIRAFVAPWADVKRLRVAGIFAPFSYIGFGNQAFWRVAELVRSGIQKTVPGLFGWWNLIIATKRP